MKHCTILPPTQLSWDLSYNLVKTQNIFRIEQPKVITNQNQDYGK